MLSNFRKNVSISGASTITTTDEFGNNTEKVVVYMSASIDEAGGVNINKNMQDKALYAANKTAVRADMLEFETKVYEIEDGGTGDEA